MEIKQISKVQENLTKVMVQGLVSVLVDVGFNEETAVEMMVEMERRMTTAMHWLPMTPDAVFEDGGAYLLLNSRNEWLTAFYWSRELGFEPDSERGLFYFPNRFTHYARITEPK